MIRAIAISVVLGSLGCASSVRRPFRPRVCRAAHRLDRTRRERSIRIDGGPGGRCALTWTSTKRARCSIPRSFRRASVPWTSRSPGALGPVSRGSSCARAEPTVSSTSSRSAAPEINALSLERSSPPAVGSGLGSGRGIPGRISPSGRRVPGRRVALVGGRGRRLRGGDGGSRPDPSRHRCARRSDTLEQLRLWGERDRFRSVVASKLGGSRRQRKPRTRVQRPRRGFSLTAQSRRDPLDGRCVRWRPQRGSGGRRSWNSPNLGGAQSRFASRRSVGWRDGRVR